MKTQRKAQGQTSQGQTSQGQTSQGQTDKGKKNATRRTAKQSAQLQAQISELKWKGYTQTKIAEQLQVSQQLVSHYLQQIEAEVRQRIIADRVVVRQQQIDKIRWLMSTLWDDIGGHMQELQQHPENRPRVTAAIAAARRSILQCVEVENKLLGLYEKYEPVSQTPEDDLSQFSQDEIDRCRAFTQSWTDTGPSGGHPGEAR